MGTTAYRTADLNDRTTGTAGQLLLTKTCDVRYRDRQKLLVKSNRAALEDILPSWLLRIGFVKRWLTSYLERSAKITAENIAEIVKEAWEDGWHTRKRAEQELAKGKRLGAFEEVSGKLLYAKNQGWVE